MRALLDSPSYVPEYLRPPSCCDDGLGALPAIPIALAKLGTITTSLNGVASLVGLNSSDPARDRERINRINVAFQAAMAGDTSPITTGDPNTNLGGVSGAEYLECIATNNRNNPAAPGPPCPGSGNPSGAAVYGSQIAYRYAQLKWGEYRARVAAGAVGTALIGQSDIPSRVGYAVQSVVTNPITLVLLAGGAYLLLRRKR